MSSKRQLKSDARSSRKRSSCSLTYHRGIVRRLRVRLRTLF